jgi:hypothetical protein
MRSGVETAIAAAQMGREIQLDGAEISVIKTLGIGAGEMEGSVLIERTGMEFAEISEAVHGLMALGYVDSETDSFHNEEQFKKIHFRVNPGYAKELKDAIDPEPVAKQSKRVRRE